ncbi:MAG TPA: O-methyltransferase [Candidatus Salinicoccus stercoripullorum]|uniref:O-methyltransferase n=1 Tax=Candidatus Salinicoccus stercoripullorum TaxID=2838756 RepID=A0A9D1U0I6_9STAP|nr:O-methyltransferase [Candidatus Salinicoccus stercoripullorum]
MEIFEYIERMNSGPELFPDVLSYAREYKVPIMDFDALQVMKHYIHLTGAERILEIGTAIGYSALHMLSVSDAVEVVTIEKDGDSHRVAKDFFEAYGVTGRVDPVLQDAKEIDPETLKGPFDILFIDASKGNNEYFFENFSPLIKDGGLIIVDNILLRGLVVEEETHSRNRRRMKEKVDAFNKRIAASGMLSSFLPVGDGLLIISKQEEGKNA